MRQPLTQIIGEVFTAAQFVEELIAESGVAGNFNEAQVVGLTKAFGDLAAKAAAAFEKAKDVLVTPETVEELLPSEPPVAPPDETPPDAAPTAPQP